MSKKIKSYIKLQVSAGMANPSPPVGPALGQHGINIMEFCKSFNDVTKNLEKGLPVPVVITVYFDKSFTFITKTTPASILLKKFACIEKGSSKPKNEISGEIKYSKIIEIAKIKCNDMTGSNLDSLCRCIKGTAISIGLKVIKDN